LSKPNKKAVDFSTALYVAFGGVDVLRIQTQPTPIKRIFPRKSMKILDIDSSQLQ
jgi:hypothetical protein